ncbi:MAG: hypothetical protein IT265_07145 [Saprospiraceae bacterium]|nr:hypothetical protein [Saprospiraceae bacterium]
MSLFHKALMFIGLAQAMTREAIHITNDTSHPQMPVYRHHMNKHSNTTGECFQNKLRKRRAANKMARLSRKKNRRIAA